MEQNIKRIIFDKFKLEVNGNTRLSQIAKDSFDRLEMIFETEQDVNIKLTDISEIETVDDLIKAFERKFNLGVF
jgi:acyl carrier protein